MKNSIQYIYLFLVCLLGQMSQAQGPVPCSCLIDLVETSSCCAEIRISMSFNCTANKVTVESLVNSPYTGKIFSAVGNGSIETFINPIHTEATFTSSTPFPTSTSVIVGEVCFSDIENNIIQPRISIVDENQVICKEDKTFNGCNPPAKFQKIFGSEYDERPNEIKSFGNAIYIAGKKVINGEERATFAKFDNNGELLWERTLDIRSEFKDFDYSSDYSRFFVVGRTLPYTVNSVAMDNQSIICAFDDFGNIIDQKVYDHTGREQFEKVVVQTTAFDKFRPIYVLGNKNEDGTTPSYGDRIMVYNFDYELNAHRIREYPEINHVELEAHRGMKALSNRNILILGNGSIDNEGVVIEISGGDLTTVQSHYHPGQIDWYDALELGDGNILLAGTDFGNDNALLLVVDNNYNVISGRTFFEVSTFRDVGMDANGDIYTVAARKTVPHYPIVHKLTYSDNNLNLLWSKYLENGETAYSDPHLFIRPDMDLIFYTDARSNHPQGFGNFDILVGGLNIDMDIECAVDFDGSNSAYSINKTTFEVADFSRNEAPFSQDLVWENYGNDCNAICNSNNLECDFTFQVDCFDVDLYANISGGNPPYHFAWDINCDGTIDVQGQNQTWNFPPIPAVGIYDVCLTVTDDDGMVCEVEQQIEVMDTSPPDIACPDNVVLEADLGECHTTYIPNIWVTDNCDPNVSYFCEIDGAPYNSTFEVGEHYVSCIAEDASGNKSYCDFIVSVLDNQPPVIHCPEDMVRNTDIGQCFATYTPSVNVIDNCVFETNYYCEANGVPLGSQFEIGITNVVCTAEDASGNASSCQFSVTVVDNEAPSINCPNNIYVNIPGCEGGTIVNFSPPQVADNCEIADFSCSRQSGDFFGCGNTIITCTATDVAGNSNQCSFRVNVNCKCAEIVNEELNCNAEDENTYDFSIQVNSLTGLEHPEEHCTASVTTFFPNISLSNINTVWNGQQATITGSATMTDCPNDDYLFLDINFSCDCPETSGISCTLTSFLEVPCCKTVAIDDKNVCKEGATISIPLEGCDQLCDVRRVKWYLADAPCPPSSWGEPFQVTNGCQPLLIDPQFHNSDICIYAEVAVGSGDRPCTGTPLITEVATITLCEPINVFTSGQEACYEGTAIIPSELTAQLEPDEPNCPYTVQWYDINGPIEGATELTYQPPALSLSAGSQDCFVDFAYTVKVTSECGTKQATANIRLNNDNAPLGILELDPLEELPLCYGEDATLRYTPACAGDPELWDWFISTNGTDFIPILTAGNRNPLYNTNRLYQDTWYRVEKKNGNCSEDQIDFYIPVIQPIYINNFTAIHDDLCNPDAVEMTVDFGPIYPNSSACDYTIDWYRNGQIIHQQIASAGSLSHTYFPPSLDEIEGNYYVVISNNCCNDFLKSDVVLVDPPCQLDIFGPCFRCNEEVVLLTGVVINPIEGVNCIYQWYDENGQIEGATNVDLLVHPDQRGPFTFEMTCFSDGVTCSKSKTFPLKQCGANSLSLAVELLDFDAILKKEQVFLKWTTTSELNNAGFEVERSQNAKDWEQLAFVDGQGTTLESHSYSFVDKRPFQGISYYRLKQIDTDNSYKYSAIVQIVFYQIEEHQLKVFPNPVHQELTFELPEHDVDNYTFYLIDPLGKVIEVWSDLKRNRHSFSVEHLPNGVYMLVAKGKDKVMVEQFVKH